jgi:hypothetical protein
MQDWTRARHAVWALLAGCGGVVGPSDARLSQLDAGVDAVSDDGGGGEPDAAPGCRVLEMNLVLASDADVEKAAAMLTECTVITGHLRIGPGSVSSLEGLENLEGVGDNVEIAQNAELGTPLATLRGLGGLVSVGGDLQILGADITSLEGLEALRSVGGLLSLTSTAKLASLDGASQLASLGGLAISAAPALESLGALAAVAIDGNLFIRETGLTSLAGLEKFSGAGSVVVQRNDVLESIDALAAITAIGGELDLLRNPALTRVSLDALTMVGQAVSLSNIGGEQLVDLAGLGSLTAVGADLVVSSTSLTSLRGLEQLSSVGGSLIIEANALLPECEVAALADRLMVSCSCAGNDVAGSCEP